MKVLFVGHTANISGAPMVLLHLCNWLHANSHVEFDIWLGDSLDLHSEFINLDAGRVFVGKQTPPSTGYDLIYANSVFAHAMIAELNSPNTPVVSHVHELELGLAGLDVLRAGRTIDHYVAAAQCVAANLTRRHGIHEDRITVVESFIDVDEASRARRSANTGLLHSRLGLSQDTLIVGSVGSVWFYKAPELFIDLASRVIESHERPVHFVRFGGNPRLHEYRELQVMVNNRTLRDYVHLVPETRDVLEYLPSLAVFALTSREDPFPLVFLEASAIAIPVIAFSVGGAQEFLRRFRGEIVQYPNVQQMAERVRFLLDTSQARFELGQKAAVQVREQNDVAVKAPEILKIIEKFAN